MNWLVVVAGGKGERMDLGVNKIFAKIGNLPILYWTLLAFEKNKIIDRIIISAGEKDMKKIEKLIKKYKFKKVKQLMRAGTSRQDSTFMILKRLKSLFKKNDLVGIHNAVNPFVNQDEIRKVYSSAQKYGAALLAQRAKDTVKITNDQWLVEETPLRQHSWYAQTPQVAKFGKLYQAHLEARKNKFLGTDDAQLLERIGTKPKIVPCSNQNFKITFPEDLAMAAEILKTWTE